MASVIIVNLNEKDADLIRRIKYNLEKAGFSITESYTSGVVSEDQKNDGIVADTITFVFNK